MTRLDFDAFVHDFVSNQWQVHGVQVYCGGELTYSFGDTCNTKYPIYSATKSILSVAVGIACDQGRLELQRSILDYLPTKAVGRAESPQAARTESAFCLVSTSPWNQLFGMLVHMA